MENLFVIPVGIPLKFLKNSFTVCNNPIGEVEKKMWKSLGGIQQLRGPILTQFCIFRTYYQCQANGARRGGYEAILKHCAAGTAFDPKSGICNHVSSLSCEKELSQSEDLFELRGTSKITNPDIAWDIAYKQIPLLITHILTFINQDKYFSLLI